MSQHEAMIIIAVNKQKIVTYDKDCSYSPKTHTTPPKRRLRTFGNILEHYTITIRPKLHRSSSLSDLASNHSDFTVDLVRQTSKLLTENKFKETLFGCSGDAVAKYYKKELTDTTYLTWNFKGKKARKKNMNDCTKYGCKLSVCTNNKELEENTSFTDNTSVSSAEQLDTQKGASFPFKSTPSGNLKVQSNQVVFQSSTVGVLLADPTQAKVKVQFGGAPDEQDEDGDTNNEESLMDQLTFYPREVLAATANIPTKDPNLNEKPKFVPPSRRDDRSKDLSSLGYNNAEPIDWLRIQLPKKQDLLQEFYKRIHNYVNTDTIVHIADEQYHCHRIVLQIYSEFFEQYPDSEIELPADNVTPDAFQTIYEWMINGPDSNRGLKRENILDVFIAAQFLRIKDLEEQCWNLIVDETVFTEDSAFALFREAYRKGLTPVMDLMIPRVTKFFLPLVASKDFLDLEPDEVMAFMKSNNICVTSEIEVLMAVVRWLYGDWNQRQALTVEVMRCVRFGLISPWQLVDIKRNPDNEEILEIVNKPEVQQMVDDGLAYVIIKYWYGNNSKIYYHWIDVLGLTEPAERNWIGEEKNHVTYKEFLKYLEQFAVPRDQMYQQMAIMQNTIRTEEVPGSLRGLDNSKLDMKRPFPFPANLRGLSGDKEKDFPMMNELIESRKRKEDSGQSSSPTSPQEAPFMSPTARRRTTETETSQNDSPRNKPFPQRRAEGSRVLPPPPAAPPPAAPPCPTRHSFPSNVQQVQMCTLSHDDPMRRSIEAYNQPEKEPSEDANTGSSDTADLIEKAPKSGEKRHSVAASYLAAATAHLSSHKTKSSRANSQAVPERPLPSALVRHREDTQQKVETQPKPGTANVQRQTEQQTSSDNSCSAHISLFNHSKESLAKMNMNKLSASVLGPPNKNYVQEGSLFNWDRETVLVFGGIDPHNTYGVAKNTGQDVYRFDPVGNVWEVVGELPEPRHHHSVAFLKGRVYLVGGADPRDDDVHGKSVVVSTVWSFEPVTRSWHSEAGLSTPRKNFGLVVHRMALYAIGGQDKKGRVLRSVEKFDYKTSSWAEVRSMHSARMAVASVKYREYIWVAGGMTGDKKNPVCKTVECYNSNTNEWTQIHSLRFPRCFATMFTMNDKLYIIGGAGKTIEKDKTASSVGAIDAWDWTTRKWRLETEMSIPRHGHALAYLGTQLIIIGGVTTIYMRALNNVESYCCERGAWIRGVAALPSPLSGHGAVTLPPASLM